MSVWVIANYMYVPTAFTYSPPTLLQDAKLIMPLISWVNGINLEHLEPLMAPCLKFMEDGLKDALSKVPAFQSEKELQRVSLLWLEHILPIILDNDVDSACKLGIINTLKSELKAFLVGLVKELLDEGQKVSVVT